jgi:hypothetical protein
VNPIETILLLDLPVCWLIVGMYLYIVGVLRRSNYAELLDEESH